MIVDKLRRQGEQRQQTEAAPQPGPLARPRWPRFQQDVIQIRPEQRVNHRLSAVGCRLIILKIALRHDWPRRLRDGSDGGLGSGGCWQRPVGGLVAAEDAAVGITLINRAQAFYAEPIMVEVRPEILRRGRGDKILVQVAEAVSRQGICRGSRAWRG